MLCADLGRGNGIGRYHGASCARLKRRADTLVGTAEAAASPEARRTALYDTVVLVPARNEEVGDPHVAEVPGRADAGALTCIIVVVNNSTDRTEDFARQFADDERTPPTVVLTSAQQPAQEGGRPQLRPRAGSGRPSADG